MSKDYSEDQLIEQPCMDIFQELSWETADVYERETFGEQGTLGRDSESDVILRTRFYNAIKNLNPNLPQQAYDLAYESINSNDATKNLSDINFEKYNFLKDGIPVNYKDAKGEIVRNKKIKVFDFDNPKNNNYIAVQQLWMQGKSKRKKRPDIVGFVNGLPLVFIELKGINVKLRAAYEKNLKDYKNTIPKMFHCNAFVILSNGVESKIGSISSKYEHFHDWKRISEEDEGMVSLDTIIRGTCEKSRLLDLFENFILFDTSVGSVSKLVARNHQFIGVNKAIEHFQSTRQKAKDGIISIEDAQKLGVFWHTQGSGKSYSMVFLCQKILRVLGGGYTFLLVTDRNELDKQIYGTFAGVGAVKDKTARATSGANLKELLKSDKRFLFSIIHKFNFDEKITDRENIIVISDEAHRTQGGSLAMNLRKALPNASFIGFTGTPLFKDDEMTRRIFGDYVSKYDFKRSIEDGATVPLYYENRGEKLELGNPQISEDIREAIEEHELDSNQEDKLKKLFAREYPILTSEKRLRAIAKDVVEHFNSRGYKGKAMYVAIDKVTAVRMYNYISEAWDNYLEVQQKTINKISDEQDKLNKQREWEWSKKTELGVVVSHEQNEIEKFEAWGLDIDPHRLKMNTSDLEKDFKDEDHPFRFAIVCAMWITGFDVKSLSTMYIDKPLKSHTLMQTIARANRVHKDKNNGLIVDYIETYKALLEALAIYGDSDSKGGSGGAEDAPVKPLDELVEELDEAVKSVDFFLKNECNFILSNIINAQETLIRIKHIQEGYNAICETDETKEKFGVLSRELFKKYKALMPEESIYTFQAKRDAINALYTMINAKIEEADVTHIVKQVQDVVDKSIETLNLELEKIEGYGQKIDISSLDFKKIEEEFLNVKENQNIKVQSLKDKVSKKLNTLLDQNPLRIDFYERYQQIIEDYNQGKEYRSIKEIFDSLVVLLGDLSEEGKRAQREGLQEDELTVFDMLVAGKRVSDNDKSKVKEAAQKLLERLKQNEFKVDRWAEKTQTASAVRKVIEDYLYVELPSPSFDDDVSTKADILYNDFKERFANYTVEAA